LSDAKDLGGEFDVLASHQRLSKVANARQDNGEQFFQ
jgi:hypothetical protein